MKAFEHQTHHRGQKTIYIQLSDVKSHGERALRISFPSIPVDFVNAEIKRLSNKPAAENIFIRVLLSAAADFQLWDCPAFWEEVAQDAKKLNYGPIVYRKEKLYLVIPSPPKHKS